MSILITVSIEDISTLFADRFVHVNKDVMIRLTALISCGIGISAFEWSLNKLTPVFVDFRNFRFLALVPYSTLAAGFRFFVFEAGEY